MNRPACDGRGLAKRITAAFYEKNLNISRPKAPNAGWDGMPEVDVTNRLRNSGASDVAVRLFLTFTAAMDRARDADALWNASGKMFLKEKWAFEPRKAAISPELKLAGVLKSYKVSQRHEGDVAAWRTIAGTLGGTSRAPGVHEAIYSGKGDAKVLLREVVELDSGGKALFPLLRGPKISAMLIRMLVCPGEAEISNIDIIPVAVDVQVRKVTEYLGVTDTIGEDLAEVRELIQRTWAKDVKLHGAEGPAAIVNTPAALDPALWFFAKWGCTHCEKEKQKVPIADVCDGCRFDLLCPGGRVPKRSGKCS